MSTAVRHDVGALADFKPGAASQVELGDGESGAVEVVVVRIGESVYAIGARCTHIPVTLATGEVWADDLEIECIHHGSCFSLVTGEPRNLPATRPVPVYAAEVVDGRVIVTVEPDESRQVVEPVETTGEAR